MNIIKFALGDTEKVTCDYEKLLKAVKELSWNDVLDFINNANFDQKDYVVTYYPECVLELERIR